MSIDIECEASVARTINEAKPLNKSNVSCCDVVYDCARESCLLAVSCVALPCESEIDAMSMTIECGQRTRTTVVGAMMQRGEE